jgi:hypothetical protein
MSGITSITLNGVEIVTSDRDLVLSLIASPAPTAPPKATQSAVQPSEPTRTKSAPAKPRKPFTRKSKTTQEKAPAKALLAEIRSAYRSGDFVKAKGLVPSGWVQVANEVEKAEGRAAKPTTTKSEAPKVTKSKPKTTKSAPTKSKTTTAKPKAPKGKSPKVKAPKETVPTGTEGDAVVRVTPKEIQTLNNWKNLYTGKVNDLLAGGSADDVALGYAELVTLIDALDVEASNYEAGSKESGRLIAKAIFLADLSGRLTDFVAV